MFFLFSNFRFFRLINKIYIIVIQLLSSNYFTYHLRPKRSSAFLLASLDVNFVKSAIVIQGPIIEKDNFTIESIKLYRKLYPKSLIILSTWVDSNPKDINKLRSLDVEVLLNDKPNFSGESNINFQIVSSKAGIIKAKTLGAEYVMKTRTDQRMYSPNVDQFLFNIINLFPLNPGIPVQKKRIIGISMNTFQFRMYGLSDMFMYGHIDDMLLFWNISLDARKFNSNDKNLANSSLRNFANWRICEVFLTTEFLNKVGHKLQWTLKDSWEMFANHFCIIDKESLDLYWGKYDFLEYRWTRYDNAVNIYEEFTFKEWLNLYCNFNKLNPPEHFLDLPTINN